MGVDTSTYVAYGVHVPREKYVTPNQTREADWIDAVIKTLPRAWRAALGHLQAGNYDQDELFLICQPPDTYQLEAALGTFMVITPELHATQLPVWDSMLRTLVQLAGYEGLEDPGWIVTADCS